MMTLGLTVIALLINLDSPLTTPPEEACADESFLLPNYKEHGKDFHFASFDPIEGIDIDQPSMAYKVRLQKIGAHLKKNKIGAIVFVHGTAVGNDPAGAVTLITQIIKKLKIPQFGYNLKSLIKDLTNKLAKDTGNFTDEYIELIDQNFIGIEVTHFDWSSRNNHIGRLRGAVNLIHRLSQIESDRILLIGHSHAGQLFALITQMINNTRQRDRLLNILFDQRQAALQEALIELDKVNRKSFDIVTLGTPPRYVFCFNPRIRLINIINHRGDEPKAGDLEGIFMNRRGDYIQHLGIAGSDTLPIIGTDDFKRTQLLDAHLGPGYDLTDWYENVSQNKRVPTFGTTLLIDYKDQGIGLWKMMAGAETVFGHGVYTQYDKILFNFKMIIQHLYPQRLP